MLPVNIIANWCMTTAKWEDLVPVLEDYLRFEGTEHSGGFAARWEERTLLTFGETRWAQTEASLIFNNQRAILWHENPRAEDRPYLIFIGLLQSSLINLKREITKLVNERLDTQVKPVEFGLGQGARELFNSTILFGGHLSNNNGDHLTFSKGRRSSGLSLLFDYFAPPFSSPTLFEDNVDQLSLYNFFLSDLYLRLGESEIDLALSRNGNMTFSDPDLTLTEIASVASQLVEMFPINARTESEQSEQREQRERIAEEDNF